MRIRNFLFASALVSIALITSKASPTLIGDDCRPDSACDARTIIETGIREPGPSAPSLLISKDEVLGSAYHDTLSILRFNNPCSAFFGGPDSVDIFKELVSKIRKDVLPVEIGMRMSGPTTYIHDARTNTHYRLFDNVSLNSRGPFYRKKARPWEATVPRVGTLAPNTREARVLILLHELGHVTKGSNGRWLLPDDGGDERLSRVNSHKIENVCNEQIHNLGKAGTLKDLRRYKDRTSNPISPSKSERTQPEPLQ